jgi:molybdate transport system substrate-binding protein
MPHARIRSTAPPAGDMSARIVCISSMATRLVLVELAAAFERQSGHRVEIESVGGVDAARRVQAGESFDVVVLASDAIARLVDFGHLVAGSRVDLVRSPVALAVPAGAPRPDLTTEAAVRNAVRAARRIGYSTGPSGTHLARLFERWGVAGEIQGRIVQAPPGVPVAALLGRGDVELGFQQLSELLHQDGVEVVGTLPATIEFITVFSAALCPGSTQTAAAREMLAFMASPACDAAKRRHGMEPA